MTNEEREKAFFEVWDKFKHAQFMKPKISYTPEGNFRVDINVFGEISAPDSIHEKICIQGLAEQLAYSVRLRE